MVGMDSALASRIPNSTTSAHSTNHTSMGQHHRRCSMLTELIEEGKDNCGNCAFYMQTDMWNGQCEKNQIRTEYYHGKCSGFLRGEHNDDNNPG